MAVTKAADHPIHMLDLRVPHHIGFTAWRGLGESYKSLPWEQNMSLWLFGLGEVLDPCPLWPRCLRPPVMIFREVNKAVAFLEGQLGTAHLGVSGKAVFGP